MKNQPFYKRFVYAWTGIQSTWKKEASFRTQVRFALLALVLLGTLRPNAIWWALILMMIALVLSAELINTALENILDRIHPETHPLIGNAKDCAAGAVLVLSITSVLVALAMCFDVWMNRGLSITF